MAVCGYVHMSAGAIGYSGVGMTDGCKPLIWDLGTALGVSGRTASALTYRALSPSSLKICFMLDIFSSQGQQMVGMLFMYFLSKSKLKFQPKDKKGEKIPQIFRTMSQRLTC